MNLVQIPNAGSREQLWQDVFLKSPGAQCSARGAHELYLDPDGTTAGSLIAVRLSGAAGTPAYYMRPGDLLRLPRSVNEVWLQNALGYVPTLGGTAMPNVGARFNGRVRMLYGERGELTPRILPLPASKQLAAGGIVSVPIAGVGAYAANGQARMGIVGVGLRGFRCVVSTGTPWAFPLPGIPYAVGDPVDPVIRFFVLQDILDKAFTPALVPVSWENGAFTDGLNAYSVAADSQGGCMWVPRGELDFAPTADRRIFEASIEAGSLAIGFDVLSWATPGNASALIVELEGY